MSIAMRRSTYRLVDRACFALLELTRCTHLLVSDDHNTPKGIQSYVDALNIRIWDAKFSLIIASYKLKKELQSLITLLFNLDVTGYIHHLAILNLNHLVLVLDSFWLEPKKSNAP